jgi:hypothetical protein
MKYIKLFENIDWDWVDEEKSEVSDFEGCEDFYNFLIDNNILDEYIYNFNKYKLDNKLDLKVFFDNYNKRDYLLKSFLWKLTKEGYEFWEKINIKWYKKIGRI